MNKITYFSIKESLNNKTMLLSLLIVIMGAIIPAFSIYEYNFFKNILYISTNPWFCSCLCIAFSLHIFNIGRNSMHNYNFIIRYKSFQQVTDVLAKQVKAANIVFLLCTTLILFSFSMIFSLGNFAFVPHPIYNMPFLLYLSNYFLRVFLILQILSDILFILYIKFGTNALVIATLLNLCGFLFLPTIGMVSSFKDLPILFFYYFQSLHYSSFFLEVCGSILQIWLLLIVKYGIKNIFKKKVRDIE